MSTESLTSLLAYSQFVAEILHRPSVLRSTVAVWSDSPYTGIAEGEVFFVNGLRLRVREELDFAAGLIASYGYEVYRRDQRLYWYDDFPHPNDPILAASFPHHKHVPPDVKHNREPAPQLHFDCANLPVIVSEMENLDAKGTHDSVLTAPT
jgi:hypothetical protein